MSKRYWQILSSRFMVVRLFLLALMMSIIIGLTFPALTQSSVPKTRQELVQQIKKDAARHLELNDKPDREWVVKAYKDNKFKLAEQEISVIYEEEFIKLKKEQERNPFEQLFKNGVITTLILACMVAIGAAIGAAFGDTVKKWSNLFFDGLGGFLYQLVAGNPISLNSSLQRYRKALITKYQLLKIPFRPNLPLAMREIYVPLKVAGSGSVANIEAFEAVKTHRRLMVTGAPGSGKSMLLKSLILAYAEDRLFSQKEDVTPILLELNRLSDSTLSIEQYLVEALGRDDFLKATWFVKQGLKNGNLMLLLDGLDELNGNDRPQVVKRIKEFLDKDGKDKDGKKCRVIITCRTQVYNQEFHQETDQVLEIVEFSDQQIRRFLGAWKSEMPAEKSVEQLIQTLRERPRIMALARNPLLLTIIAYLYTDTTFILPHSRSEFYQQATEILLEKWDQSKPQSQPNQYRGRDKRQVLQVLALYNQDSTNQHSQDRRSMDYLVALEQVKLVLPSLNLAVENAEAILNEIVERSGLLLAIDGGQRYQFSHLTLQEFFAAAALSQQKEELVTRFEQDKDAWREVVKLWCGLADQSTELIRAIYAIEPITAFECLADANNVAPDLADQIIDNFEAQIGNGKNQDAIAAAFGLVASINRPGSRGESVFNLLKFLLFERPRFPLRVLSLASKALAMTNLPKAASLLVEYYQQERELTNYWQDIEQDGEYNSFFIGDQLIYMGDLAVSLLLSLVNQDDEEIFDIFRLIATPNSADALTKCLWNENLFIASEAAWHLSTIFLNPEIEEVLRDYKLTEQQRQADYLEWVWLPFNEPNDSALPIIAGRIAYLMNQNLPKNTSIYISSVDPRLGVPLCAIESLKIDNLPKKWNTEADTLLGKTTASIELDQELEIVVDKLLGDQDTDWRALLSCLNPRLQLDLLHRLINYRRPVPKDWANLFKKLEYEFQNSWHYRVVLIISFLASIIAIIKMLLITIEKPENTENWLLGLPIYVVIVFWLFLRNGIEKRWEANIFMDFGFLGLMTLKKEIEQLYKKNLIWVGISPLEGIMAWAWAWAFALVLAGAWAFALVLAGVLAAGAGAGAGALVVAGDGAVAAAGTWVGAVALALALAVAGTWVGAVAGFLSGLGLGLWKRAEKKEDWLKYFPFLAFPWFCTFPIVFIFSTLAMHDFLSWQLPRIFAAWIIIFGTCTALWQRGQKLDRDARNPLYGILDKQ